MQTALEARRLVKQYPGVLAVDDVSFTVGEGVCFGLLGPNGAGKTTTVEIMEGVTPPTSGEVWYYGSPAGRRFREEAGIQFQNTALQDFITVRETLEMFQSLYDRRANLERIIEQCSLEELQDRDNRKLSGGQRQRLLLAVALVNRPRLVFLDEPTTGLDPQARRNFWDLVKRIRSRGYDRHPDHALHGGSCRFSATKSRSWMPGRSSSKVHRRDDLLKQHYKNTIIELPMDDFNGDLAVARAPGRRIAGRYRDRNQRRQREPARTSPPTHRDSTA